MENKFFGAKPVKKSEDDGCKVKIRRDKHGRISEVRTSGKCTKQDLELLSGRKDIEIDSE